MEKFVLLLAGITLWLLQVNAGGPPPPSVTNSRCRSFDLLFGVTTSPTSTTVNALNDVTLTCSSTSQITPSEYSWYRINGDIPSSSSGQNTNSLTLHDVVPADEGEYYCLALLFDHCARSNNVMVSVIAISCPSLSEPINGIIKCSVENDKGFSYEDTCNFTCETGYELTGSDSRTCQNNGNWSGSIAMCTRAISVEFDQVVYSGSEASGNISVRLLLRGGTFSHNISVIVMPSNQSPVSAEGGVDYGSTPINATFTIGSASTTVYVPVIKDNIVEELETFNITIVIPSSLKDQVILGNITNAVVNIIDNTTTEVRFNVAAIIINESSGVAQIFMFLSNPLSSNITFEVYGYDTTATGGGEDYDSGPYTVFIPAKEKNGSISVSINDDNVLEEDELFTLFINSSSLPSRVTTTFSELDVIITDDDVTTVKFSQSVYNVNEDSGLVQLMLVLSNPVSFGFTVEVFNTNVTAIGGDIDYGSGPYIVTIPARITSVLFDIPITNDNVLEQNENFNLTINASLLLSRVTVTNPHQAIVTIMDDDTATISFNQSVYTADESEKSVKPVLVLSNPLSTDITVNITDSATGGGDDYVSGPYTVKISAGQTQVEFNITIRDDNAVESNETLILEISSKSLPDKISLANPNRTTVTIVDNDAATVSFGQSMYSTDESVESVKLVLVLSNPSSTDFTVQVTDEQVTAEGDDYVVGPYFIEISAGQTSIEFNVSIMEDNIVESNEYFILRISPKLLPIIISPGAPIGANVTIEDNDAATISFNQSMYSINENDGAVKPVLVLSKPSSTDITVQVTDEQGTAIGDDDYVSGLYTVKIRAGLTEVEFNISIMNDNTVESNETFSLAMTPGSLPNMISINPIRATVTIVDTDTAAVSFNQSMYSISENGGSVKPVLVLSNPSSTHITVQITDIQATATESDYQSGPYIVTISALQTYTEFNVSITDDTRIETDEYFILEIMPESLSNRFSLGNPYATNVIIVENDEFAVFFDQSSYSVIENATIIEIVLRLSSPLQDNIMVQIIDNGSTADSGDDYKPGPYNVTFTAGMNTSSFTVSITDDDVFEDIEYFILKINSVLPSIINIGDLRQATVAIEDNEVILVQFSQSNYTGSEEFGIVPVTLVLVGGTSPFPVTVIVIPSNDSSVSAYGNGVDYNSTPINATFVVGSTNTAINIPVTRDSILEQSETFRLNIIIPSSIRSRVHPGSPSTATGNINDSNVLMVQFSQTAYSGSETSGNVRVMLLLRGGTSTSDITVTVMLSDISAKGNGVDYTSTPIDATFTAGSTNATISILVTMDALAEESETFSLKITIPSSLSGKVVPGDISTANGTITDDTMISVNFSQSTYMVDENNGIVQFTALLSNPSSSDITIEVYSIDGTATGDDDYKSGPYSVKFIAEMTSASFNVAIKNNNVLELDENFVFVINTSSLPSDVTVGIPTQATVTIVDDDTATVSFENQAYSINEADENIQPVLVLSNPSSTAVTVKVLSTDGSATGADYSSGTFTVEFKAETIRATFNVTILEDNILEGSENFSLSIDSSSLPSQVTITNTGAADVTIVDDDVLSVEFAQTSYLGSEKSGFISITLLLKGGISAHDITIMVTPSNQSPVSAEGDGVDYDSTPVAAIFLAGATTATINISLTNDSVVEESEIFNLTLTIPSSISGQVILGANAKAIVNITDDTTTAIRFRESTYSVNESSRTVQPVLVLSNALSFNTTVEVITANITTLGQGVDYDAGPYTVGILAGETNASFTISITDDNIIEENEIFLLIINSSSLHNRVVLSNPNQTTVVIVNDDVATVRFEQQTYVVTEADGKVRPVLILSHSSNTIITVQVFATDGRATGSDYEFRPYMIEFIPGVTRMGFDVLIINDNLVEGNETFILSINESSLSKSVAIDNHSQTAVIIVDDDTVTVDFNQSSYGVNEENEVVQLTLLLSNPTSSNITIQLRVRQDSAKRGRDYLGSRYSAVFHPGTTFASFNINIVNDNIFENDEVFTVTIIENMLPNGVSHGAISGVTVTIMDIAIVSFEQPMLIVDENSELARPSVVLKSDDLRRRSIIVETFTTDGSATGNMDYVFRPFSLPFTASVTSIPLRVQINDDDTFEGDERFTLTIDSTSLPKNVVVNEPSTVVIVISDDKDAPTVYFEQGMYTVNENELLEPVLILTGQASIDVIVQVSTIDGSAIGYGDRDSLYGSGLTQLETDDGDYVPGPYTITFKAGNIMAPFNFSIIDDNIFENSENFNLTISSNESIIFGDPSVVLVVILDNDTPTLSFKLSTYIINESDELVELVLLLSNPSSTDITLQVLTTDGSATGYESESSLILLGNKDYAHGPYTAVFSAGTNHTKISIPINNDNVFEGNENFTVSINSSLITSSKIFGGIIQATVTILDNDPISISFSQSSYSVNETVGSLQAMLVLSNPSSANITVMVLSDNDTATENEDYVPGPYVISIIAGMINATFKVTIVDDIVLERNEKFMLTIDTHSLPVSVSINKLDQAMVTIVEDDVATVMFEQEAYTINEADKIAMPILLLSNQSSYPITVEVFSIDGSAIGSGSGMDFFPGPYIIEFDAGVAIARFNVSISDDNTLEKNETFNLGINTFSLPKGVVVGYPGQSTVIILANDVATLSFKQSVYNINESDRQVQVFLVLSNPSSTNINVKVEDNNVTALRGDDYDTGPYNVTFIAGMTTSSFVISIIDDDAREDNESFILTIDSSPVPVNDPNKVTVTIVDHDVIAVFFIESIYSTVESNGVVRIVLMLSNVSSTNILVNFIIIDDLFVGSGDIAYGSTPYMVEFAAGMTNALFYIPIIDNNLSESNKNFTIAIDPSSLPNRVTADDQNQAVVIIVDDDDVAVSFKNPRYSVYENNRTLLLVLVLSKPSSTDIIIIVVNYDNTTIGGVDYEPGPYSIMFPAGQTNATFSVSVMDDEVSEGNEYFNLAIDVSSLPIEVNASNPADVLVTIVDDEVISVSFKQSSYSIAENNDSPLEITLVLSEISSMDITVQVTDDGRTAVGIDDYNPGPFSVTFPAGTTEISFNISIKDDKILEDNEDFLLKIKPSVPPVGTIGEATVTIVDDDVGTLFFTTTMYSVAENAGSVKLELALSNPSSNNITVLIETSDKSAKDYIPGPYNATFLAGSTRSSFTIEIINDNVFESTEEFVLTLNQDPLPFNIIVVTDQATVMIMDDDGNVRVAFNQSSYTVYENDEVLPVLTLSNPSSFDVSVRIREVQRTAKRNIDYIPGPYFVTIPTGQTHVTFNISVIDDDESENDKMFNLIIVGRLSEGFKYGGNRRVRVNIVDDDKRIRFQDEEYIVNEADDLQPVLRLSHPFSMPMTIQVFSSNNGSATGKDDYNTGPFDVEFSAGMTLAPFNVTIARDNIFEGNETFYLLINQSALPSEVSVEDPGQTTVIIVDDNVLSIQFSNSTFFGLESSGNISVTLILEGGTSASVISVTVQPFDQSPVSAQGNEVDYTSAPITATFSVGSTSTTIDVPVSKDDIVEERETFNLNFSIPSLFNDQIILGNITTATGFIVDDTNATVRFGQAMYTVDESDGVVQVLLILSNPSSTSLLITVFALDESAEEGFDFDSGPYNVIFPPNMINASFNISITNDAILEQNETFTLNICPPDGFFVVDPDKAMVTIMDDDTATISFNQSVYSINEDEDSVQPVIVLSNPSSTNFTVQVMDIFSEAVGSAVPLLEFNDILSAEGDVDYNSGPYNISIPAGKIHIPFKVLIRDDNITESNEHFILAIINGSLPDKILLKTPDEANVIIVDNDVTTVSFHQPMYTANEGDDRVELMLVLSNPLSADITIQVYSIEGSATAQDYRFDEMYTIDLSAGNINEIISVSITNDNILEDDEAFSLIINATSLPDKVTVGDHSHATVIIMDNDVAEVYFNQTAYSITEDSGLLQPVLVLSIESSFDITVNVTDNSSTATGDNDYNSGPYSVMFSNGSTIASFDVPIINDNVLEINEEFVLTIDPSSLLENVMTGNPTNSTVTIVDNEVLTIRFSNSTFSGMESSGIITITLILEGGTSANIINVAVVPFNESSVSAQGDGVDFAFAQTTATFSPGSTNTTINITVSKDNILEEREIFNLNFIIPLRLRGQVIPGNITTATGIIIDDTNATVGFGQAMYTVDENDGVVQILLILSNPSSATLNLTVFTTDISANGGADYDSGPYTAIFSAGMTNISLNISITDDTLLEMNETFVVSINSSGDALPVDPDETLVTIVDDDNATITFSQSTFSIIESGGVVQPMLILSEPLSNNIAVIINDTSGTAMGGGIDYFSGPYTIQIPAGIRIVPFNISIVNDMLLENIERFVLNIINLPSGIIRGDHYQATVIIFDDDDTSCPIKGQIRKECVMHPDCTKTCNNTGELLICPEVCNVNGCECPDGTVVDVDKKECVELGECPVVNVFVGLNVKVGVGKQVIINCEPLIDRAEMTNLMITWIHNDIPISNGSTPNVVISEDKRQCIITETSVSEGGQLGNGGNYTCEICGDRDTCISNSTIIDVCGEPNLALPSSPPTILPSFVSLACGQNVTLPSSGVNSLLITCTVFNGSEPLAREAFKDGVPIPVNSGFTVLISPFADDDFGNYTFVLSSEKCGSTAAMSWILPEIFVFFNDTTYSVDENTRRVESILALSSPSSTDVTIQVADIENTAKRDSDYNFSIFYNVTIPAGQITTPFNISITDDNVLERNESFNIFIIPELLPSDISLGNPNRTTVTIVDDDTSTVSFEQQTYIVNESNEKVQVVLTLSNPSSADIMIEIITTNGSAIGGGEDYDSGPYSVKFIAGMTKATVNVSIVDDNITERNATFNLSINTSSLPNKVSVGDHDQAIVTIVDNDVCKITKIDGGFKRLNRGRLRLTFSSNHPQVTYRCKIGNEDFMNCVSPLRLSRRVNVVLVRAFCLVDGMLEYQTRRRFRNN